MKTTLTILAFALFLMGCGKKPDMEQQAEANFPLTPTELTSKQPKPQQKGEEPTPDLNPKTPTEEKEPLPKDFESLKALAEKGDARAQNALGYMYNNGEGVPKNDREAMKWYRKAAEQGFAMAQHNLGMLYQYGEGVPQDNVTGYAWNNVAASNDFPFSKFVNQARLAKEMTADQIAEADALAKELIKSNPKLLNK